jgi:hypothetical protein
MIRTKLFTIVDADEPNPFAQEPASEAATYLTVHDDEDANFVRQDLVPEFCRILTGFGVEYSVDPEPRTAADLRVGRDESIAVDFVDSAWHLHERACVLLEYEDWDQERYDGC